jgi:hypothetical protein
MYSYNKRLKNPSFWYFRNQGGLKVLGLGPTIQFFQEHGTSYTNELPICHNSYAVA